MGRSFVRLPIHGNFFQHSNHPESNPMLKRTFTICAAILLSANCLCLAAQTESAIPLPENPRPDFERADWLNLNGQWQFHFDKENAGEAANWSAGKTEFPDRITVPFSWGCKLSGLENKADIAWYQRSIKVPESWKGKRVFLVVGACDWLTKGWLDGQALGEHQGGYTPFEFELTPDVKWGDEQQVVLRVDDTAHDFKLYGKQGYGDAKGIWQTIYLEARPAVYIKSLHYLPDIDSGKVTVRAQLSDPAPDGTEVDAAFQDRRFAGRHAIGRKRRKGSSIRCAGFQRASVVAGRSVSLRSGCRFERGRRGGPCRDLFRHAQNQRRQICPARITPT